MDDRTGGVIKGASVAARANGTSVHKIGAPRQWTIELGEIWDCRALMLLLAWRSIRVRYKQTIVGFLWAVIGPVGFTLMFALFFSLVPVRPSDDLPYVPTAFAGLMLWQFFSRGVTDAGVSLTANANLITKIYFPRVILPLAAAISSVMELVITSFLLVGLLVWYGVPVGAQILFAPLFVVQVFILVVAFSLWLSAIDGLFRDLRHALPLLLQFGMFISPVAYTTNALIPGKWQWLYKLNPMVAPIEGFRASVFPGANGVSGMDILISIFVTGVIFVLGAVFFARVERKIVDLV